ncbi:fatty acid synthase [Trichonephila clavipes]|nr:fatty acid synthase [Trichonephila clavipes]
MQDIVKNMQGTKEKREFLQKRFPKLLDKHFCNSRDLSFEKHILDETNGEGVDVILNSLAEEKLKASLNCIAQNGRFLEIGKYDFSNNSKLVKPAAIKGYGTSANKHSHHHRYVSRVTFRGSSCPNGTLSLQKKQWLFFPYA